MSPIRTVITTITRKSVNMVAELDYDTAPSRILDTIGQRLEGNSTAAKAAAATSVALDTQACAIQRTVSCSTEERTRPISIVQDRNQGSACDCSQDTERFRSRHRSCTNARKTYASAGPRATRPTGQGSIDHRHRRLEDDERRSR